MNIITGPVGSGKTYKLLKLVKVKIASRPRIIVCRNRGSIISLVRMAEKEGFTIYTPITYSDLQTCIPPQEVEYLIDDLDQFLAFSVGVKVSTVTIDSDTLTILESRMKDYKFCLKLNLEIQYITT